MGVLIPAVAPQRNSMLDGFRFTCIALAATEGVSFSTEALGQLFQWLDAADLRDKVSAGQMLEAQVAIVHLVHEAAITAQRQGESEISASILWEIRSRLCPLPPWIQPPC